MPELSNRRKTQVAGVALGLVVLAFYQLFLDTSAYRTNEPEAERISLPPPPALSAAKICAGGDRHTDCWIEVANQPGCYVWISSLQPGYTISWDGECSGGLGEGTGDWVEKKGTGRDAFWSSEQGLLVRGLRQGPWSARNNWVFRDADGETRLVFFVEGSPIKAWGYSGSETELQETPFARSGLSGDFVLRLESEVEAEGPFVDGKMHGTWTLRRPDENVIEEHWENGVLVTTSRHAPKPAAANESASSSTP